jgi:hypothetical protein
MFNGIAGKVRMMFNRDVNQIYPIMRAKQVQEEIDALRKAGAKIRRSKGGARAFLIKHGFVTKDWKLTKQYGG